MKNSQRLLWLLAIYPWLDFAIRLSLPSVVGSVWDDLFLGVILLTVWIEKGNQQRVSIIPRSIRWPFYFFGAFALLSIIVHVVPLSVSIDAMRVVFEPMFFGFLTLYLLDEEERVDRFMKILIISTVFIAIAGIIQYVFKIESVRWEHKKDMEQFRIVSIFSNPNALAGYLNMILGFLLASILLLKEKKQKLLYSMATIPVFIALLLTFSRGSWIAFLVMLLYFIWVWNKKWLFAVPILAAITPFVMPASIVNRFAKLFDPTYYQMSSEYGRIAFWAAAFQRMKENPIFGVGLGMFGDSVPLRHNIPFATWVDNHYIKLGAEIGVVGLLAFVSLLLAILLLAHRMIAKAKTTQEKVYIMGIAGAIITMSIQNVTASILEALTNAIYFYALIGMLFALLWKQSKER